MAKICVKGSIALSVEMDWPVETVDRLDSGVDVLEILVKATGLIGLDDFREEIELTYRAIQTSCLMRGMPLGTTITHLKDSKVHYQIQGSDQVNLLSEVENRVNENTDLFGQTARALSWLDFIDYIYDLDRAGVPQHLIAEGLIGHSFTQNLLQLVKQNRGELSRYLSLSDSQFAIYVYSSLENQLVADLKKMITRNDKLAAA